MDLVDFTKFLVTSIIKENENILVERVENKENVVEIHIKVCEENMGKIIGKNGKIINAIRTLVQEASCLRENQYVKIEIERL